MYGRVGLKPDLQGRRRSGFSPTLTASKTLRTLLDHSAALADVGFDNYGPREPLPTLTEVLKNHSAAIRVESVPGRQHSYSGTGYVVLQQLHG